jgi:predicted DsbA family dithiol-disulfide isomerase
MEIEALREKVAPDLFAGFDPAAFPHTSIPAFGLTAAAYSRDDATGEAVSLAIRTALFEHGLNIADPGVLAEIGHRFGVESLGPEQADAAVRADWERGKVRHVKGSPHFFVGDHDWFCPGLVIHHADGGYDVELPREQMHEFYDLALN